MPNLILIILFAFCYSASLLAGDDDHHHEQHQYEEEEQSLSNIGPHKAITYASKRDGFKLSGQAIKNLNLKSVPIISNNSKNYQIPISALVSIKDKVAVYRVRKDLFKLIEIEMVKNPFDENQVQILSAELSNGDEVVTQGVGLLRIAELQIFGTSGNGHGH